MTLNDSVDPNVSNTLSKILNPNVSNTLSKILNPTLNIAVSDMTYNIYDRLVTSLFREVNTVIHTQIELTCLVHTRFRISLLKNAPS